MEVNKKKCTHSNLELIEALKHTIINTHHPISNSRVESINNFEVGRVKEIKVPAYKCLDCGEIIDIKELMVASYATTHNHGSYNSCAVGRNAIATVQGNIAIGAANAANAGMVNTDKDIRYSDNYSEHYLQRSITDMSFLEDMGEALKNAEIRQEKAMKNYKDKQVKLDRIPEKVRELRKEFSSDGNITSEIDRIKQQYDNIVNRQQNAQQQAQEQYTNNDLISKSIREAGSVLNKVGKSINLQNSPPPPPPIPQARNVGTYDPSSGRGYYQSTTPQTNINDFTNIEFLQFMFTRTNIEEKTFKDIKYFDITFPQPVDQEDSKLDILEKGDVIEWVKVPKNKNMGILSPKIKAIKAIRISVEDLEEARKQQTNEG